MASNVEVAIRRAFRRLGYADVKEEQLKAAREFITGRDVFVCLPTGSSKSMCYGCLPYSFDELEANTFTCSNPTRNAEQSAIVLIVCPLTVLMEDQVKKFTDMGLKASFVGEAQDDYTVGRGVMDVKYSLVYMSPESMMTVLLWREMFRSPLYQQRLKGIVIDEAHCVEKWNHMNDTGVSSTPPGLPPLKNFTVEKLLLLNPKLKIISVSGKFAGRSDDRAVIFAEKHPLKESDLNELFSEDTELTPNIENDIYGQYQAVCQGGLGTLKLLTVYPATDAHVAKYSDQLVRIVHETPEDYQTVTKPFIEREAFGLEWVYNILEGKSEAERVLYNDPDPENGFILLPDMKWDQKDRECLYLLAIAHQRGISSMRELTSKHLTLLKNILHSGKQAIMEKYGLPADQIRVYVHYQPSYYHLHVHFTHLKYEAPKTLVGQAHHLEEVIDNIEHIDALYYQKKTITFVVKESSPLWYEFNQKKR